MTDPSRPDNLTQVDGYATTIGSASLLIGATEYLEQGNNAQRSVASTDANDTSGGTGARTVKITYFDQTMAGPFSETVTMNGLTPVNTIATNIAFVERMDVITVGSNNANVGSIALQAATGGGGDTIGSIAPGDNETNWCFHYVGAGKYMYLHMVIGSVVSAYSGEITIRRATPTIANSPNSTLAAALLVPAGDAKEIVFPVPIQIAGPAQVALYAKSKDPTGTANWNAGFGYNEA